MPEEIRGNRISRQAGGLVLESRWNVIFGLIRGKRLRRVQKENNSNLEEEE